MVDIVSLPLMPITPEQRASPHICGNLSNEQLRKRDNRRMATDTPGPLVLTFLKCVFQTRELAAAVSCFATDAALATLPMVFAGVLSGNSTADLLALLMGSF